MALVLGQANYDVVTTPSLAGAMKLAKADKFDLFVLDSVLDDGTGIELCRLIRLMDDSTPILFCSGKAYESDKVEAFNSGAQRYLVKPIELGVLCLTVAQLLRGPDRVDDASKRN
jgi:DNA-binding response OmpR family regulator